MLSHPHWKAYAALIAVCFFWGTTYLGIRMALESFPPLTGPRVRLTGIPGSPPDLRDPPSGCRFHTRCPRFLGDVCRTIAPPWQDDGSGQRYRCHIPPESLAGLQRADRLAGQAPARAEA